MRKIELDATDKQLFNLLQNNIDIFKRVDVELIGSTRVTSTRLISRLRAADLLLVPSGETTLSLAPEFVEAAPLSL